MYEISNAIRTNIMDIENIIERILLKFQHLPTQKKVYFTNKILRPNLQIILKYKDMIYMTNILCAATIYKQILPTKKFSPLVLNYILTKHLPYFYYVFYHFFDSMTLLERQQFGFDLKLFSETFTFNSVKNDLDLWQMD